MAQSSSTQFLTRQTAIVGVLLLVLYALPMILPIQRMENFIRIFLLISLVASWNVLGYTRYINFGHVAFYGTGAYVVGLGITVFDLPIPLTVLLAGVAAGLIGLGLGLVTLRIRGHYFAIASLMLLFIMNIVFTNVGDFVPGASQEMNLRLWRELSIAEFRSMFYHIFLTYALFLVGFSAYLERSKYGYAMRAIGGDEDLALSLGVNTTVVKNIAITISAFTCGIVGGTHALYIQYIDESLFFPVSLNFLIVFVAFVGGIGVWAGPVVGSLLFVPADELFRAYLKPEFAQIFFGFLFVIIILFRPDGLTDELRKQLRRLGQSSLAEKPPLSLFFKE